MANKRRRFGNVRQLPSGRWQVRYRGPDGQLRSLPRTFEAKRDAERTLSVVETQLIQDDWTDPKRGTVTFGDYAQRWITQRPGLRPSTVQLYHRLLRKYVLAQLGDVALNKITTVLVREWRAALIAEGVSQTMAAKAYRLLRAILMTAALEDRLIPRNPCQIRGADKEYSEERPVLTVAQVLTLAEVMPYRKYRALILITAFCSLRWGEVTALRRCDVAPDGSWVRVSSQFIDLVGRGLVRTPPKSRAGVRTITVPAAIRPELVAHLRDFVAPRADALVFTMLRGGPMRRGNFNPLVKWGKAVAGIGAPSLRFHDLRHTGNTLAAPGASLRDLMTRMGHDSPRAAMIYQHATTVEDRAIADRLSGLVDAHHAESNVTATQPGDADDDDDGSTGMLVTVR
ncbi:MAG: site-specific integrase [Pseudonocardiales bacterium]|nr:site-specific integrase [Pseudonocardiales bacterium]MBV9030916.1 site-specific integrase [Pseudonocardiales bacterium]